MWLENADCKALRSMIRSSTSHYLISKLDGSILWANPAFCDWSGYTLNELTKMTWIELSSKDSDFDADLQAIRQLDSYTTSYRVQKKYIPKNSKPQIGTLDVTRWPATGEIEYCMCKWEPMVNGTAQAFEFAIESYDKVEKSILRLSECIEKMQMQTEEEKFGMSALRMMNKHPKITIMVILVFCSLVGFTSVTKALQDVGLLPPPVVSIEKPS